ncbi:MAG: YdeI/OmpD-associated family protein [Winogradskyella sp.]|uniref:YdeI/OmpD-associated family protein n=1 Tax=Winogradskyella sp. TaxID=1883156 RepID=UPI0025DED781|nr:YdeI/OmpD-associated family protein [Winogradskyella sp.]NRB59638.1 YdeI/OmpD-associated family protein [Winogradskyella sp.]
MIKTDNFEKVEVNSSRELRNWLSVHYNQTESVWLVTYKKDTPEKYVSTSEILDELLCFGWIDGIRRKLDDDKTMQLISKRKAQHWAKTYKDRAEKLISENRMAPSGYKSIKASKENGMWDFMNDVDMLIKPDDLEKELSEQPEALAFFDAINDSSKRFVLRWIKLAKTDKTRKNRIKKIVQLSAKGEKLKGS